MLLVLSVGALLLRPDYIATCCAKNNADGSDSSSSSGQEKAVSSKISSESGDATTPDKNYTGPRVEKATVTSPPSRIVPPEPQPALSPPADSAGSGNPSGAADQPPIVVGDVFSKEFSEAYLQTHPQKYWNPAPGNGVGQHVAANQSAPGEAYMDGLQLGDNGKPVGTDNGTGVPDSRALNAALDTVDHLKTSALVAQAASGKLGRLQFEAEIMGNYCPGGSSGGGKEATVVEPPPNGSPNPTLQLLNEGQDLFNGTSIFGVNRTHGD